MAERPEVRSCRILLVDDDLRLLFYFERGLRDAGFSDIVAVENFEDARSRLRTTPFDVLITDVRLGASNGLQLAVRAREMYTKILLIVISGFPDEVLRQEAEALGGTFLVKPFSIEQVIALIQKAPE